MRKRERVSAGRGLAGDLRDERGGVSHQEVALYRPAECGLPRRKRAREQRHTSTLSVSP